LGREARTKLARMMYEDVLATLLNCNCLEGILVVTPEREAAEFAESRGARVILEDREAGLNAALRTAVNHLGASSGIGVVIVPSDLPQLSSHAITTAVAAISCRPGLAIAPAQADGGTNLLACRPAAAVPLHFGPSSFLQHLRAAQQAGLRVQTLELPELLLDIDRPDDLQAFCALQTNTRTQAFLMSEVFGEDRRGHVEGSDVVRE
jgi:2-phospho-L-lactate/phosphoenolpyruvate guanylyltransferase